MFPRLWRCSHPWESIWHDPASIKITGDDEQQQLRALAVTKHCEEEDPGEGGGESEAGEEDAEQDDESRGDEEEGGDIRGEDAGAGDGERQLL